MFSSSPTQHILPSSPLPMVEELFRGLPSNIFENVCVFGGQHILPTNLQMFYSFFSRGLNPTDVFLIGKCYSTDKATYQKMLALGISVCPSSIFYNSHQAFDTYYKKNSVNFLKKSILKINKRKPHLIIVLDDGAYCLLSSIKKFLSCAIPIVGVEQTSSGFHMLNKSPLPFPIINAARSWIKLQVEAPLIAKISISSLQIQLKKLELIKNRVLVVGAGAIGHALHKKLEEDYAVTVYDIQPQLSTTKLGLQEEMKNNNIIIGCTGNTILSKKDYGLINSNTVLISTSSSDREFKAENIRQQLQPNEDCHANISYKKIHLLNSGFPVNFNGVAKDVDPPEHELTRSIMTQAIIESMNYAKSSPQLLEISPQGQNNIFRLWKKYHSFWMEKNMVSHYTFRQVV